MHEPQFIAVLLYPGCIFFEIALAGEALGAHYPIRYYTPEGAPHTASNGAEIRATGSYAQLAAASPLALLVPGGDPGPLLQPVELASPLIATLGARGCLLAGICGGNLLLAAAGQLRGRRGTHSYTPEHATPEAVAATAPYWEGMDFVRADLVRDGPVITAQAWAYREYAATLGVALGVLQPHEAEDLMNYPVRKTCRQLA